LPDRETIERLAVVEQKARAAHERLDTHEEKMSDAIKDIAADIRILTAYMHKSRGAMLALVSIATVLGTLLGSVLSQLIPLLLKR
jgi:ABC-type Fe3+-citrate transport system substrate-binding protein